MSTTIEEASQGAQNVTFLLEHFVEQVPGVEQVVGVSADGLLMSSTSPLEPQEASVLAATVSGLTTLAVSASGILTKGPLRQVITAFRRGHLMVCSIDGKACLGIITFADCDLGLVAYETTLLVERVGALLTPELITEMKTAAQRW